MVGLGGTGHAALDLVEKHQPDVLLLALPLRDVDAMEMIDQACGRFPGLGVVVLAGHRQLPQQDALLSHGMRGYMPKTVSPEGFVAAVQAVVEGHTVVDTEREPVVMVIGGSPLLTSRELEVLRRVAEGDTDAEIAQALKRRRRTVEDHLASARVKLSARSRTDAAVRAYRLGLL